MRDYCSEARRYRKFRNSKVLSKMLYIYRAFRWMNSSEISKAVIYDLIAKYYGDINTAEKKRIYKDARKACYTWGPILENYFKFRFYSLTKNERKKYSLESPISLQYAWGYFNDFNSSQLFNDKFEFYRHFSEYFHRDIFLADKTSDFSQFEAFCRNHKTVFIKPRNGMFGFGAEKYEVNNDEKILALWETVLSSEEGFIVEEVINAEATLKEFHPNSINALRIVTLVSEGTPEVLCAYVRLGNGGLDIEHLYTGAIGASIDLDSGIVCTQGVDQFNNLYTFHPYSKKQIVGYQFKNWDQCIALVKEMALVVPNVRFVGWDVVINDRGEWLVVEGNHNGTFEVAQTTMHKGLQERIDEIINYEEKSR